MQRRTFLLFVPTGILLSSASIASAAGWYQGIWNGEVKNSSSDAAAFSDGTSKDVLLYSRIDTDKTAEVMESLGLDIFITGELALINNFDASNPPTLDEMDQSWQDMAALIDARHNDTSGTVWPATIAGILPEPSGGAADFIDEYIGSGGSGYDILSTLEIGTTLNAGESTEETVFPDVLVIPEPDNWIEQPHEPAAYTSWVPRAGADNFFEAARALTDDSGNSMELWAYMGDRSVLQSGIPSWTLVANPDGTAFNDGEYVGMTFDLVCTSEEDMPEPVVDYQKKLLFAELSFLHYDTEDPYVRTITSNNPTMRVYVEQPDGSLAEIATGDNNYTAGQGFAFDTGTSSEGIELINSNNLVQENSVLTCDGTTPNTVHVRLECDLGSGAVCNDNAAHIADIQFQQVWVTNCGGLDETWTPPSLITVEPFFVEKNGPIELYDDGRLQIDPVLFYYPLLSFPYQYPYPQPYFMSIPLPATTAGLQQVKQDIAMHPSMQTHPICLETVTSEIDIDTEISADNPSSHLSIGNGEYRFFSPTDPTLHSLDGLITRYNYHFSPDGFANNFDKKAQDRLMQAATDALADVGSEISLLYVPGCSETVAVRI